MNLKFFGGPGRQSAIATLAIVAIVIHLLLRFAGQVSPFASDVPLWIALALGGVPLVAGLLVKLWQRQFGSDLLAGISIITSVLLGEYLAGVLVVLMLSGGEALEAYVIGRASSALAALAKRMPSVAHRKRQNAVEDIALADVAVGDVLQIFPHEICPVDGVVTEGRGTMDESYLTGEPFLMSKAPGSDVLSGAINGETALTINAVRLAVDSRHAKIMRVMRESEQQRPQMRRLGDQLGAWYTPLAVGIALLAWGLSGEAIRFLAVLVVATPCPLLIAIPVAIIGAVSLSAQRGVIVRDPSVLERIDTCRTAIFDKTGTLTYGKPKLTEEFLASGFERSEVLALTASVEQYSKHPLSLAILADAGAKGLEFQDVSEISERPGEGLKGTVAGKSVRIIGRKQLIAEQPDMETSLPPTAGGLECVILIDNDYAATYRFRDAPRADGLSFVNHLSPNHSFSRKVLLSGDRESEVRFLAHEMGIEVVHAGKSPEEKLAIVREETSHARTLYLGDGINDAPALMAATVGVALGSNDVTSEAAGAVILDGSLRKVDEFLHISRRMRGIALQSALGGMALSMLGMLVAASGHLPPVAGAVLQEIIDVLAVLNALRAAFMPRILTDFELPG